MTLPDALPLIAAQIERAKKSAADWRDSATKVAITPNDRARDTTRAMMAAKDAEALETLVKAAQTGEALRAILTAEPLRFYWCELGQEKEFSIFPTGFPAWTDAEIQTLHLRIGTLELLADRLDAEGRERVASAAELTESHNVVRDHHHYVAGRNAVESATLRALIVWLRSFVKFRDAIHEVIPAPATIHPAHRPGAPIPAERAA